MAAHETESNDRISAEIDVAITESSALLNISPSISNTNPAGTGYSPDFDNDEYDTNVMGNNNTENAAALLLEVDDHIEVFRPESDLYSTVVVGCINDNGQHGIN